VKIKNVLIIGSGSIAKKHIKFLNKNNIKPIIINIKTIDIAKKKINDLIKNFNITTAIICSPASTHLKYINFFKKKKIHFLVEKPLLTDSQLKLINKNFFKKSKLTELVGYQLRYNKTLINIKKLLKSKFLGKLYNVKIVCNSFLPMWRKKKIKNSISLSKKKGGGVLLELSHEIDYMLWLFGDPDHLKAFIDKIKIFNKEVEESANLFFYYKNFNIQLEISFNSRFEKRSILIEGKNASISADLLKNIIHINKTGSSKLFYKNNQQKIDMLFKQDEYFIKSIENRQNANNLQNALKVLNLIKLSRKSNLNNQKIKIT
jgi:predicted dehydrogenase